MADSDPVTKKDLEELKVALTQSITESITESMTELIRDVETSLLTSFHGYGKGQAGRMTALEVGDAAVKQRLDALEQRVLSLETRRPH
jgi:hypothetical protein